MADCIFCAIAAGGIPAAVVYEDEHYIAIRDIHPQAAVHLLVMPRRHWDDLSAFAADSGAAQAAAALPAALAGAARACGIEDGGYRVISNCGTEAGQSVRHLHFHVLGGEPLGERIR